MSLSNESNKKTPLEIAKGFYYSFFHNPLEETIKEYVHENAIWTHYGPLGFLPFYGKFYGQKGFVTWVTAIAKTTSLTDFIFERPFYIVENNIVHTHVLEGSITLKTKAKYAIENFHSLVIEDEKIKSFTVISETSTVIDAYINGISCQTKYEHIDYKIEENLDINKTKEIAKEIYKIIQKGKGDITNYVSDDIEIAVTGIEGSVPYINKYVGKEQAKSFVEKITPEVINFEGENIIADTNKVDIFSFLNGKSSTLSKDFYVPFNICFQFNKDYKVANIYIYNDNYLTSIAYKDSY
ncbi:MAG: hypothetical protein A2086_15420 [Spirochaetes bacterium GWD1_27_9]|nr:MAG: hypothetical protein A2Z98_17890 [Spirochaetes bacterium GWB1_27_13]OHD21594.1 MAG: hypothetical protein A2Y34_13935 [Spirochaetes bacterium GWC1_27_15]OHD42772.1 MAG: hypothetical protein A2086_15420 [Spirochaetes bacterium GWD1_27_9]